MTLAAAVRVQKVLRQEVGRIGPQRVSLLTLPCLNMCCRVELETVNSSSRCLGPEMSRRSDKYHGLVSPYSGGNNEDGSTVGAANGL